MYWKVFPSLLLIYQALCVCVCVCLCACVHKCVYYEGSNPRALHMLTKYTTTQLYLLNFGMSTQKKNKLFRTYSHSL